MGGGEAGEATGAVAGTAVDGGSEKLEGDHQSGRELRLCTIKLVVFYG